MGEKTGDKEKGRYSRQGEQHKQTHKDWSCGREVAEGSCREETGLTRVKDEPE